MTNLPEGGRITPRNHGDDIPVMLSPGGSVGDYELTATEAAREVGVTRATIDTWVHRGYLTAIDPKTRPRRYWASQVFATEAARRVHPAHRGE